MAARRIAPTPCSACQQASILHGHMRAWQDMLQVMHSEGCTTRLKLQQQQMCASTPVHRAWSCTA